jgi:deoxyadenosine/deoxycytidine kinase
MSHLVTIAGNTGSGKTTLAKHLCQRTGWVPCWEQPTQRPFQREFSQDPARWGLANQVDFQLFRAEQEMEIRTGPQVGVMDGGLDQDYHVFTRLFHRAGKLGDREFEVCRRMYGLLRQLLPPPEVIVRVVASEELLLARREARGRSSDELIVPREELTVMEALLDDWLENTDVPVLAFDAESAPGSVDRLISQIIDVLGAL